MLENITISGIGYTLGSEEISNKDLAQKLGLPHDWFFERTGILTRKVCGENQDVVTMGAESIVKACQDANIKVSKLGHETIILHIQNGFTHLTPPPGILVSNFLKLHNVRSISLDGVCAEPINGFELASLLLGSNRCERVIVSSSVDFLPVINPNDENTAGLFGAGAGAVIFEKNKQVEAGIKGVYWENKAKYYDLGVIPVKGYEHNKESINIEFSFYQMNGKNLARVALSTIPRVIKSALKEANWTIDDVDYLISHQPNAKLLKIGIKQLKLDPNMVAMNAPHLGNMGPASLLVSMGIAKEQGNIKKGSKVLLLSFGLGFSCGAAAIVL